ncbi:MATE family efflux transporter [Domibacillus indicus]|uniref:MATE family efflux transporter n=1 Tax=Domibacillus indicus TaxID=1437523 RepID=UPI00203C4A20|nr:MATE family efflux transporter [Domibacillus indicus]MCM3790678.1 MATE family efflux transporter [Domibacillus indicus]
MRQIDFTNGNIFKQLFFFSTPIMAANLLQVSYQFVDSLWVGNLLGADALGAVSIASTVILTVLSFILGINNAALTILSQQRESESTAGLKSYLNAFVVLLTGLSLLMGAAGYLYTEEMLKWLDTPTEMIPDAAVYLQINFIGILFLLGYNFISTVLRALGDSQTPLYFVLAAVLLNIVLDPVFISVFGLGINGAAWATVISQGLAFIMGVVYTLRRKAVPFSIPVLPKREEVLLILKLGIPAGLQMTVIYAGVTAIMTVVNSFGSDAAAGFGAAQRLDSLITLPAMALGTAVNSMAGQNIAGHHWNRVRQIALYGALYNFITMLVIAVIVFLLARFAITLFIREEEAVQFGTSYLKTIAFFYPFIGLNFILNGIVRASGAMYQVLVLNILSFWVLRYPLTYLCSAFWGEDGIALGMGIGFVISSAFSFGYYRFGKWRRIDLFASK